MECTLVQFPETRGPLPFLYLIVPENGGKSAVVQL